MSEEGLTNKVVKGIGVSSGIAFGKVRLIERGRLPVTKRSIKEEHIQKEVNRFRHAIKTAIEELNSIKESIPDDEVRKHAFIIDAHMMILQDDFFTGAVIETIKSEKVNAEWALDQVVSKFLLSFEKVVDPYLKERGQDIKYIYSRLARILVKGKTEDLNNIRTAGKSIIVAHDLSPADTIQLNMSKVSGFVTEVGGRTSHTSIVARALEIPAVVAVQNITSLVKNNDSIVIDGDEGIVIINPSKETQDEFLTKQIHLKIQKKEFLKVARLKAETKDGYKIKVGANIELLAEMDIVKKYGGMGVGLYRTEYIFLSKKGLPTEEEHFHIYRKLAENKDLEYVTVRTLDIGGDKFLQNSKGQKEANPALGLRAIRLCIKEMDIFKAQLMGILRASAYGPLKILIPMVSGTDEVKKIKGLLKEYMDELSSKGIEFNRDIKLGIMVEVPSTCMISDMLAPEVDFFSIGTNDLIQYTLAIDRVNEYVSYLYEPLHPAVLRMIKHTVQVAHAHRIEVALCGEMAGEPLYVPILLGLELDELSMNPYTIPKTKKIIRGLEQSYCKELLKAILNNDSAKRSEALLREEMKRLFPKEF
ncbi:MAG: phosphoenolpyruvate--protein phosphotransferase [Syntrophorhabdaceae bacterium]|nr:phosphoenolpyruvate--protein phosphotransferase [Syntrophorhabdaceae bacterium]